MKGASLLLGGQALESGGVRLNVVVVGGSSAGDEIEDASEAGEELLDTVSEVSEVAELVTDERKIQCGLLL